MRDSDRRPSRPIRDVWTRPPIDARVDQDRSSTDMHVADLRHDALKALVTAWRRAGADERSSPPSRSGFRPTEVVEVIGRVTILERIDADSGATHTWRFRLAGGEINAVLQHNMTGETIDRFHPPLAAMLRDQFDRAVAGGEPMAFAVRAVVDHRPYAYEKVVLPVRSQPGGAVDQVVVASFPVDPL